jgi:hypothetical protein
VRKPDGEESWQVDYPAVMQTMRTDLAGAEAQGPSRTELLAEGRGRILHFPAGPQGSEVTHLEVVGRGTFPICSDGPLSHEVVENMGAAIAGAPPQAFANVKLIFVLGELGATQDAHGRPIGTVAGFAQYQAESLYFTRERMESPASARETMWHEAGHLFDRAHHTASSTLLDDKQVPVFGYGKLIAQGKGIALDASDFISKYAATNEQEDFAEVHRVALEMRSEYNARHPGSDLFTLSSSDVDALIRDTGYSEGIRRRMGSVVRIYQEQADPKV